MGSQNSQPTIDRRPARRLTTRPWVFVEEYLGNGFNATKAVIKTGHNERRPIEHRGRWQIRRGPGIISVRFTDARQ